MRAVWYWFHGLLGWPKPYKETPSLLLYLDGLERYKEGPVGVTLDYTRSYSLGLEYPWVYQNIGGAWVLWNKRTRVVRSIRAHEWEIIRLAEVVNQVRPFDPSVLDSVS